MAYRSLSIDGTRGIKVEVKGRLVTEVMFILWMCTVQFILTTLLRERSDLRLP
jgi:hypothetical protein